MPLPLPLPPSKNSKTNIAVGSKAKKAGNAWVLIATQRAIGL